MKYTLSLFLLFINLYADNSQKIWTMIPENVSMQSDLDDVPLAKTYPVEKQEKIPWGELKKSSIASTSVTNMQQRIDEIRKMMDAQIQKKQQPHSQKTVADKDTKILAISDSHQKIITHEKTNQKTDNFMLNNDISLLSAGIGFFSMFFFVYLLIGKNKTPTPVDFTTSANFDEPFAIQLERFYALKAEVRHQFILRKQNILFNNDFTQYQKAKALIELEKEYTDLECVYLPKLMSNDFLNFVEGKKQLIERAELREAVQEFTDSILHKKKFSKMQKDHILNMMKGTYKTSNHIWQYDNKIEQQASMEKSYLLQ